MRHRMFAGTVLLMATAGVAAAAPRAATPIAGLPLVFEAAVPPSSGFIARGESFSVRVAGDAADFALRGGARVRMSIEGSVAVKGEGKSLLRSTTNYLSGADRRRWRTGVPTFARARFDGVLPGIDVEYYGKGRTLEFDFAVAPFADASLIRLRYDGARRLRLEGGDLVVETASGELRQHRPVAYQPSPSGRREVAAAWVLDGRESARFQLGRYDRSLPLVIDPAVNYSSYLGASGAEAVTAIATDAEGWVYLAGTTTSPDLIGTGLTAATGPQRAFLAKVHPALTGVDSMAFCTIFGGNGSETPTAVAVDERGVIYVSGHTSSSDFPVTENAAQAHAGGGADLFLIKIGVFGDSLVYSTLLGGTGNETGGGLAITSEGFAYLSGGTASRDFPVTAGALQTTLKGASDAIVARIDTAAMRDSLTWSSYFGGSADDSAATLALENGSATIWIGGVTQSPDFPKAGRFISEYPGAAAGFLSRLDLSGESGSPLYSTFLGGAGGRTEVRAVVVDGVGYAGAAGVTESAAFPTSTLALRRTYGGAGDAFLTIVNPLSSTDPVVYSTLLGGTGRDAANALALDPQGNFWVAGSTASSAFPASTDAFQEFGGSKAFLTGINARKLGSAGLVYSTAIGGNQETSALAVLADRLGNPYVAGGTSATDFPLGARRYQDVPGGGGDGFLTVFEFQPLPRPQRVITPTLPGQGGGGGATTPDTGRPSFTDAGVTNAASAVGGAIAPGEIVRIGGAYLGPESPVGAQLDGDGKIATSIGEVAVTFDGTAAPLVSVSAGEIVAIVPYAVAGRVSSSIVVTYAGQASDPVVVQVAESIPGIFATSLTNADGGANTPESPAAPGSRIAFLATGEGQTNPPGVDGLIANGGAPVPVLPVSVTVDGVAANVISAGGASGNPAGYMRVVVELPGAISAQAAVVLTVGSASSPSTVVVSVQ